MEEKTGLSVFFGVVAGMIVAGALVFAAIDWGAHRIQMANSTLLPPLLFVPK